MNELHKYTYAGPVVIFGKCVDNCWKSETVAVSVKKARSNLTYQYKYQTNRLPNTNVILPGKIVKVD